MNANEVKNGWVHVAAAYFQHAYIGSAEAKSLYRVYFNPRGHRTPDGFAGHGYVVLAGGDRFGDFATEEETKAAALGHAFATHGATEFGDTSDRSRAVTGEGRYVG